MRVAFSILLTAAAAIQIQQPNEDRRKEGGQDEGPTPMPAEGIAKGLMDGSCGELVNAAQNHIGFPFPNEEALAGIIQTYVDSGEIEGNGDLVLDAISIKRSECRDIIAQHGPDDMLDLACHEWLDVGEEMGWVNPNPDNFRELFDVPEDLWAAGETVGELCGGKFEQRVKDKFGDDGNLEMAQTRWQGW